MARCIRFDDVAINAMFEAVARFHETEVLFRRIDEYYNLIMKKIKQKQDTELVTVGFSRDGRHSFFVRYEQYFCPLKNEVGYLGIKLREGISESDLHPLRKRIAAELFDFFSDEDTLSVLEESK